MTEFDKTNVSIMLHNNNSEADDIFLHDLSNSVNDNNFCQYSSNKYQLQNDVREVYLYQHFITIDK